MESTQARLSSVPPSRPACPAQQTRVQQAGALSTKQASKHSEQISADPALSATRAGEPGRLPPAAELCNMASSGSSQRREALTLTTDKLADKALVYADAAAVSEATFAALAGSAEAAKAMRVTGLLCEVGSKVLCLK